MDRPGYCEPNADDWRSVAESTRVSSTDRCVMDHERRLSIIESNLAAIEQREAGREKPAEQPSQPQPDPLEQAKGLFVDMAEYDIAASVQAVIDKRKAKVPQQWQPSQPQPGAGVEIEDADDLAHRIHNSPSVSVVIMGNHLKQRDAAIRADERERIIGIFTDIPYPHHNPIMCSEVVAMIRSLPPTPNTGDAGKE
jgi:hypothetical protein